MSIVEIHCPNCLSKSVKKDGKQFCCNQCGTWFMVAEPKKEDASGSKSYEVKYGLVKVDMKKHNLSVFELKSSQMSLHPFYVFKYQLRKQLRRGNNVIEANLSGYAFYEPFSKNTAAVLGEDTIEYKNIQNHLVRECYRLVHSPLYETTSESPDNNFFFEMLTDKEVAELEKKITNEITAKTAIEKSYFVRSSRKYDAGKRTALITFGKKDVSSMFLGCYVVPLVKFEYTHPGSEQTFGREILGTSEELVVDALQCWANAAKKECTNLPELICPICQNLACNEHQKQCEKCGVNVCGKCIIKKGVFSKHYFCSKCIT